jgi:cytochrome P450
MEKSVNAVKAWADIVNTNGGLAAVRLLSTALRLICDEPGLQRRLREHRELIPRFIEETLRLESPIKGAFRLAGPASTPAREHRWRGPRDASSSSACSIGRTRSGFPSPRTARTAPGATSTCRPT